MPFELCARVGTRKHNLIMLDVAHWRHLANTIEASVCGGDESFCQINSTTYYYYRRTRSGKNTRPTAQCLSSICPPVPCGLNSRKVVESSNLVEIFLVPLKGSDTLKSFLSKVAFESNLHGVYTRRSSRRSPRVNTPLRKKLARIEHVLIVKVYFERRKIAKVFMTHAQDFFRKSLSKATFERKLSSVSQP